MDLESVIKEHRKKAFGEVVRHYFGAGWVFDKAYEKIILFIVFALAMWKVVELVI